MPYCKYTVESLDFMGAQFSWDPPPPPPSNEFKPQQNTPFI